MRVIILTLTLIFTGVLFLFAADLVKKETADPCVIALEEIAETVNERLNP